MPEHSIFIRVEKKNVKVRFEDIQFVEACKNYIRIVTVQRAFMVLLSLRQLSEILPEKDFCRIHRSFIVSMQHLTAFDQSWAYVNDIMLPIGLLYKDVLTGRVNMVYSDVRPTLLSMTGGLSKTAG